jgi:RNA polymerase sigma-70 factor (ECF subfamily)
MPVDYTRFNDQTLIHLITRSHQGALSELYDRYARLVFSVAASAVGDVDLAEEITQDVFLRVWERAETYIAAQGKVMAWIASIARNRSIDVLRRRRVRVEGHSVTWAEVETLDPPDDLRVEENVDLAQRQQRVRSAIAQLPPEQQQALALAYFKGYTHQEIAAALDEPLGTVKTRIRLAMQKLNKMLREELTLVERTEHNRLA